jgi:multidrug efflux pump
VERLVAAGLPARDAARRAVGEVAGPVVAIALVLAAVFVPTAFIGGISGQFYRQFALTIAASTVISAFNSLTLSPALCALLLADHSAHAGTHAGGAAGRRDPLPRWGIALVCGLVATWLFEDRLVLALGPGAAGTPDERLVWGVRLAVFAAGTLAGLVVAPAVNAVVLACFRAFNVFFDLTTGVYGAAVGLLLRASIVVVGVYVALMALTYYGFTTVPVGFIPDQDKGYLVASALLPDGASLERTEPVVAELERLARETPGVAHVIAVSGYSLLANTTLANAGGMFVLLEPFAKRRVDPALSARSILRSLRTKFATVRDAAVVAFNAPPVEGVGNTGGFKLQVRDRTAQGPEALEAAVTALAEAAAAQPGLTGVFSGFRSRGPRLFVDVDREKAREQGIDVADVNQTLQIYLGGAYVNDFTAFGRNWPVTVQADQPFRMRATDIGRLQVPNAAGEMVPLSTLVTVRDASGPAIVAHYNMLPSADLTGSLQPGTSSGDAIAILESLASAPGPAALPRGMDFQWTDLSLQQILAGDTATYVFLLGTVFVFLVLAAQYESWSLPLAIILIVPMCLLAAIAGVWIAGLDNNIFTQIGLLVLVGLAAKNAILIVEFAKRRQDEGLPAARAVLEAAVQRLRPILMTSLAFILGVVPLLLGRGAGAEMRVSLGTAVFSGMLGVTVFGIFFTPVFYAVVMWFAGGRPAPPASGPSTARG